MQISIWPAASYIEASFSLFSAYFKRFSNPLSEFILQYENILLSELETIEKQLCFILDYCYVIMPANLSVGGIYSVSERYRVIRF